MQDETHATIGQEPLLTRPVCGCWRRDHSAQVLLSMHQGPRYVLFLFPSWLGVSTDVGQSGGVRCRVRLIQLQYSIQSVSSVHKPCTARHAMAADAAPRARRLVRRMRGVRRCAWARARL